MLQILHMAPRRSQIAPKGPLAAALREFGDFTVVEWTQNLSEAAILARMRAADVLITNWASTPIPRALADDLGRLRYVLNLGGTCKATVPIEIIRAGIAVTNWGDAPAQSVAEGALTLLLAVLKDLRGRIEGLRDGRGGTAKRLGLVSGTLDGLRLGLYGCGFIGRRFVELVRSFRPEIGIFDPYANDLPEDCRRLESLEALFQFSEAVAIWAGLSNETRGSVTAEMLARLPDYGIIINAARGEIIDQDALFKELKSGRLRAGLDVLVTDNYLPKGHEAHTWPNLIITGHDIHSAYWPNRSPRLSYADQVALDNLRRFVAGQPLRFVVDERRYALSS